VDAATSICAASGVVGAGRAQRVVDRGSDVEWLIERGRAGDLDAAAHSESAGGQGGTGDDHAVGASGGVLAI
jgi:hypothetical protein